MNKIGHVIFVVVVICMEVIIMVILRAANKDWAITIQAMIAYAVAMVILYLMQRQVFPPEEDPDSDKDTGFQ